MKFLLNTNVLTFFTLISYSAVWIEGDHVGGPFILVVLLALFTTNLLAFIPFMAMLLFFISMFRPLYTWFFPLAIVLSYGVIIWILNDKLEDDSPSDRKWRVSLSTLPFFAFTVMGIVRYVQVITSGNRK